MKRFKWHMLPLVRGIICGLGNYPLNSDKAGKSAAAIVAVMAQHGNPATEVFLKVTHICQSLGEVTLDQLKRQAILTEMLAKVK